MSMKLMEGGDSGTKPEGKSTAICNSHSEAERRRRQRINAHLSTLHTLLPNTTRTDKASLLAEVVQHVKELRKRAAKIAAESGADGSESCAFPGETDEVNLEYWWVEGEGCVSVVRKRWGRWVYRKQKGKAESDRRGRE